MDRKQSTVTPPAEGSMLFLVFVCLFVFLRPVLKHGMLSFLRNIVDGLDQVPASCPVEEYGDLNAVG